MAAAPSRTAWPQIGVLALLLAPMGAAIAASHIADIRWDAEGRYVHHAEVAPGKFVEVCGKLKPGQKVVWSFKSSSAMGFNIHYHRGKDTVYPVKLNDVSDAAQTLQVGADEVHCWMWTNKAPRPVSLDLVLKIEQ